MQPEHVAAYSRALGVSVDRLYGPSDDPIRVAHERLVSDTPAVTHARSGRRIGESLIVDLEQRVIDLRHLDDSIGGTELFPIVSRELSVADAADALLLARSAVSGARNAPPTVRALLLERLAWASARARDTDGARRVLGAVDDAYASRSPGIEEPEWVYWLDRNEIDVMAGRCLIELGDPLAAEPLLTAAINAYAPEPAREVTLYRTWLAESYARAGILDAAAAMIARARKAARGLGSVRLDVRVAAVESLLSRQVT